MTMSDQSIEECRGLTGVLDLYQSLIDSGWDFIIPFREFVKRVGVSREAAGLTVYTSHETLIFSPYSTYPDWLKEPRVLVRPLKNGQIEVMLSPNFYTPNREDSTIDLSHAMDTVLQLIGEL
jgi:hypothetical protein